MSSLLLMASLTGTMVTLLLIRFKRRLARKLGGHRYYLVCACALTLFVLPVHVPVIADYAGSAIQHLQSNEESHDSEPKDAAFQTMAVVPVSSSAQQAESIADGDIPIPSASTAFVVVWSCGALVMLIRYLASYRRFKRRILYGQRPVDRVGRLDVVRSGFVSSPLIIGFVKPTIVMPDREMAEEDYRLALLHEWNHYKQGDAWIKLAAAFINALHWFNPAAYLAVHNLSEACEYSCDERTTRSMKRDEKKRYSEMIVAFAAQTVPVLSSSLAMNKNQLFRRLELILEKPTRNRRYTGIFLIMAILAFSITATSLVFAEAPKPLGEQAGARKTYYNTAQSLQENVRTTLGLKSDGKTARMRVTDAPFYIDKDGIRVDSFNRSEPYYRISREWGIRNPAMEQKTLSLSGMSVMVAFEKEAVAYKDDKVIERMIRNQIAFELGDSNKGKGYDHAAFVRELIKQGMLVIREVAEPKDFPFDVWSKKNGDQLGMKPLTRYDDKTKAADIFNEKVKLNADVDGRQGKQLGKSFVLKSGETLAIDVKETTDRMPTVNWAIVNETTGEWVEQMPNALGGFRYRYTPGPLSVNYTFKVVMSGEASGIADIAIFTYRESE